MAMTEEEVQDLIAKAMSDWRDVMIGEVRDKVVEAKASVTTELKAGVDMAVAEALATFRLTEKQIEVIGNQIMIQLTTEYANKLPENVQRTTEMLQEQEQI